MNFARLLPFCLLAFPAFAQEPISFSLDPVFVSRFQPATSGDTRAADHVRELLEQRMGNDFIVLARTEVPDFEDYTAEVYLDSCPQDQFFGCAYVIGSRAQAEWVITGEVDGNQVSVSFIDINESRNVFSFTATVNPSDEAAFGDGVVKLLHEIIAGAAVERDLRGTVEDPAEKARREDAQREDLARSLQTLEGDLDTMVRTVESDIEPPRLTKFDLADTYQDSDQAKPWERVNMSQAQYVRFKNSGIPLNDWRVKERGRFGKVILSAALGPYGGPFSQYFDARSAFAQDLSVKEVEEYQYNVRKGGLVTNLEASFGVHKWFEVGFAAAFRSTKYTFRINQETEGQATPDPDELFLDPPQDVLKGGWQFGGRINFVPMATWAFRPTATVGFGVWKGQQIDTIVQLPSQYVPLGAPTMSLLELGGGGEVDISPPLALFARLMLEIPVSGDTLQEYHDGPPTLVNRATPDEQAGIGAEFQVGVRVRIGPLFKMNDGPKAYDED